MTSDKTQINRDPRSVTAPPAIADDTMAAATIVWNYIGELIFNMLVLVGAIKMSDRLVRELMGLG